MDQELGRANPYGAHDAASFAVATIRRWWFAMGRAAYPGAKELTIMADGGGSNGARVQLWKLELQRLANELDLTIRVSHFPSGASKWDKIEHHLFSYISLNWRGQPLVSHEVIANLIAATRSRKGLKVRAEIDPAKYEKGIEITAA